MNIEQIDSSRILISLCDKDLENYSVTFENLSLSEAHSRMVLKELMYHASIKTGINLKDKKVLIEALKYEHGCILLLTVSEKSKKRKTYHVKYYNDSYIFTFNNAENFLSCIKALYHIQKDTFSSSAFLYNQNYYLVIKTASPLKAKYTNTIHEFCTNAKRGNLFNAFLLEHAKPLKLNYAIQHIGRSL